MLRRTPRVYGNSPGSPRSRSYSSGSVFDGLKSFGRGMPEEVSKCSRRSRRAAAGASVFVLIKFSLGTRVAGSFIVIYGFTRSLAHGAREGQRTVSVRPLCALMLRQIERPRSYNWARELCV